MTEFHYRFLLSGFFDQIVLIDRLVQQSVYELRNPWLTFLFLKLTNLGSPVWIMLMGAILALYWLKYRKHMQAIFVSGMLITTWVLINYLKVLFSRNRPLQEALTLARGYSLPSGHAMLSLVFYGFLAYLLLHKWPGAKGKAAAVLLAILVLLIGGSRIYLNVHYLSDVLAGYILGAVLLAFFIRLFRTLKGKCP
ncbi:MAG: phosphatase PAP2 family protein [Syntrophomonas sp.]